MKVWGRGKHEQIHCMRWGVVADIFNPRTLKAEGGSLLVLGHLGLHSEYQDSQGCIERSYLNIHIHI